MKKIILLLSLLLSITVSTNALTYEEAFSSIKDLPNMKGVEGYEISGNNDFATLGITDGQLILWDGETAIDKETEVYGNTIYKIMGELPVAEMVQCRIGGQNLFAIFAKPVSADMNQILILSDSGGAGFTGAMIGHINDRDLAALRKAILLPREGGGTAVYIDAFNF
ncbi:MAG: hypothetical protein HFJ91_00275 [Muribaculaceae bacterium]|nr:hypothetical protein [Muribaculaceae bacterium]